MVEMSEKMGRTRSDCGVVPGWRAEENKTENELKTGHMRRVQLAVMTTH